MKIVLPDNSESHQAELRTSTRYLKIRIADSRLATCPTRGDHRG